MTHKITSEEFDHFPGEGKIPAGHSSGTDGCCLFTYIEAAPHWMAVFRDDALALVDVSNPKECKRVGELKLPSPVVSEYGSVKCQVVGDRLCIADTRGYLTINIEDPSSPTLEHAHRTDARRANAWFSDAEVVFSYYINSGDEHSLASRIQHGATLEQAARYPVGDGIFRQPLGGDIDTIERVECKKEIDKIEASMTGSNGGVLVTQDGLAVYDTQKQIADTGKRVSLYTPAIIKINDAHAVLLETQSEGKTAGRIFNLEGKKPKMIADAYKKHIARVYGLDSADQKVWALLEQYKKGETHYSIGAFDVAGTEIDPVVLDDSHPWRQARHMAAGGGWVRIWFDEGKSVLVEL